MVTFCGAVWRRRLARAVDWMANISRQCSLRRSAIGRDEGRAMQVGTNMNAVALWPPVRLANRSRCSENLRPAGRRRKRAVAQTFCRNCCTSMSAITICVSKRKRSVSARTMPFSAIKRMPGPDRVGAGFARAGPA